MTNIYIIFGIVISFFILVLLSVEVVMIGRLIAKTPDSRELSGFVRDESAKSFASPETMPILAVVGFSVIYLSGIALIFIGDSITSLIIGGVTAFSSLFFAGGTAMFEMMIYNQMKRNIKEHNAYIEAIRGK